ncbi:hypothetical protein DKT77_03875 [Meridianimarinicoccus roseus]|uniref:Uncharacterized protein n=1 Tax=Meridianimarinicoccus roseus TaxID=2072018 RepID=A0A2V2LK37_9RHOB|nr:hypothetical protein [Meridianimarinicoccus roseus]PWR03864.1 hypothetical protein DKT77_03875 [Meridianimarinicoccus roseus]
MFVRSLFALVLLAAGPASALSLIPGETLSSSDYFDLGEVADGDPAFFGTVLDVVTRSATEVRDGVVGPGPVIPGLYDVTGTIMVTVHRSATGRTVFAYDFSSIDNSGAGINGARVFTVSGFAGYTIDLGWNFDSFPYVPAISRSADGDTVTVEYFDPRDTQVSLETILLATDAPTFSFGGSGTVGIEIDSFGTTVRSLSELPAPSAVPLPAAGLLLAGALGLAGFSRRVARAGAAACPPS